MPLAAEELWGDVERAQRTASGLGLDALDVELREALRRAALLRFAGLDDLACGEDLVARACRVERDARLAQRALVDRQRGRFVAREMPSRWPAAPLTRTGK